MDVELLDDGDAIVSWLARGKENGAKIAARRYGRDGSLGLTQDIATAVAAVKIGATDYLSKPADANDVTAALLAPEDELPPPPDNPMSADRVRWEHIQRVYELCGHNVSETARRLNMHRRTLQRKMKRYGLY